MGAKQQDRRTIEKLLADLDSEEEDGPVSMLVVVVVVVIVAATQVL